MDEIGNIIFQIIFLIFLIGVNAFFAMSEMAIVSVSRTKISSMIEAGNAKAKIVENLLEEPTKFLSTIQVGITLAGFFSSASAATGIADYFAVFLSSVKIPYASQIAIVIVTLVLSYFTLVFGELVPKRIALQQAEKVAIFVAKPINTIRKIASPFIKFLSFSTSIVLKILGINTEGLDEQVSREEIKSMVDVGQEQGIFNETEREMIDSIFDFDEILAKEIMTPRTDAFMINISKPASEYVDELLEARYSRTPVYEDDVDDIIGILYLKDFILKARDVGFDNVDIREILHEPYFVPERKNIDDLFKELQESNSQMALLIDEYGGFSGIVTIQDIIEEVMGEIKDEDDKEEWDYKSLGGNSFLVKGGMTVQDFNDELNLSLDEECEDYDTIAGLIIHNLEYIPKDNEHPIVEVDNLIFEVMEVLDNRIEAVKVTIKEKEIEKNDLKE